MASAPLLPARGRNSTASLQTASRLLTCLRHVATRKGPKPASALLSLKEAMKTGRKTHKFRHWGPPESVCIEEECSLQANGHHSLHKLIADAKSTGLVENNCTNKAGVSRVI